MKEKSTLYIKIKRRKYLFDTFFKFHTLQIGDIKNIKNKIDTLV